LIQATRTARSYGGFVFTATVLIRKRVTLLLGCCTDQLPDLGFQVRDALGEGF